MFKTLGGGGASRNGFAITIPEKELSVQTLYEAYRRILDDSYPGLLPGLGRSPGEGNGTPLQYSCLENPMEGGAWWTAVYGVAQSWTRLKRLSSSSSSMLKIIGNFYTYNEVFVEEHYLIWQSTQFYCMFIVISIHQ